MTEDTKARILFPTEGPAEDEAFRSRVETFMSVIREKLVRSWEELLTERNALADIVYNGLNTLKQYIEDPEVKEVSWESPWVEARYTVEWDWERGGLRFELFDIPNSIMDALRQGEDPIKLADEVTTQEVLTDSSKRPFLPTAYQALTKQVAVQIKDGKPAGFYFLDPAATDELDELPAEERATRFKSLLEPFGIGGLQVITDDAPPFVVTPYTWAKMKPKVPPELAETIEKKLADVPEMTFTGEVQGVPYKGSVVMMFHPLVVDEDKKEAYFPIVTGLVFGHIEPVSEKWQDISEWAKADLALGPAAWEEKDREALWESLLVGLVNELRKTSKVTAEKEAHVKDTVLEVQSARHVVKTSPITLTVQAPSPTIITTGPPPPERRYLLNAPTRIDRGTAVLVAYTGGLSFPRKVRLWDDLVKEEIIRLRETHGSAAEKFIRKRTTAKGEVKETLTAAAEEDFLETVGHKGFLKLIRDPDGTWRKYVIKHLRSGAGYIEVRNSWYGQSWPLVGDELEKREAEAKDEALKGSLFDKEARVINLRQMEAIRDARLVMSTILHDFGAIGENPLRVPAWNLRTLLECEKDPDGFRRVIGCLRALQEVRFHLKAAKIPGLSMELFGPFLGSVKYIAGGPGEHTDGDFYITISPEAVGCLKVWQTPAYKIREPQKVLLFDWGKKLTKEEREDLRSGYIRGFSSLAPYFDRARGFTVAQSNLRQWIEENLTRNKDGTKKESPSVRVHPKAKDADEPRTYSRTFCELLPTGRKFHGALGHFPEGRGEHGRTLFGTPTAPTKTGGAHKAGLLQVMGYSLSRGAAKVRRRETVRQALKDMRAVVEEAFGGMVVGLHEGRWLSLKDVDNYPVDTLLKRVSWHLFLAVDWQDRIPQEVEDYHAKRHAQGKVDYLVQVTKDRKLMERAESGRGLPAEAVGIDTEPLWIRLYAARKERRLSQAAVGNIFGVSQAVINYWERGTEPDEDGKVRGKAIPADVAPLMVRWVETGSVPSEDELSAIKARRKNRPGIKKGNL